MTELIACLGAEKNTQEHVKRLIQQEEWEKVILITTESSKQNFKANPSI